MAASPVSFSSSRLTAVSKQQPVSGQPSARNPHCTAVGQHSAAYSRQPYLPCSFANGGGFWSGGPCHPTAVCASSGYSVRWVSYKSAAIHPKAANPPVGFTPPLTAVCPSHVPMPTHGGFAGSVKPPGGMLLFWLLCAVNWHFLVLSEVRTIVSVPLYRPLCFVGSVQGTEKTISTPCSYRNSFFTLLRRP